MRASHVNKLSRANTATRDEQVKAMWADGKSYEEIAAACGFANAKVVAVKVCKMKLPKRVKAAA